MLDPLVEFSPVNVPECPFPDISCNDLPTIPPPVPERTPPDPPPHPPS